MKSFKLIIVMVSALMLSGCLEGYTEEEHQCVQEKTITTPYVDAWGLTIEPGGPMYVTAEEVSAIYQGVMACMGMTAVGPDVRWMSFNEYFGRGPASAGAGGGAFYTGNGGSASLVAINTDTGANDMFARTCHEDREYLSHEFIHHVLAANGVDRNSNMLHGSEQFEKCIIENLTD